MLARLRVCRFTSVVTIVIIAANAHSEDQLTARKAILPMRGTTVLRSELLDFKTLPEDWRKHPMTPALLFATQHYKEMRKSLRDFQCILVKRERLNGRLSGHEYLATKVRCEIKRGDEVETPFSVYLQYLAPAKVRGRKVLYVAGENENRMVVRNGGQRFSKLKVRISLDSEAAMRESRYPITELGLTNVVRRMIEQAQDDMRADPLGENTEVMFFRDAKVDHRTCTHIRVVHPRQADTMDFHVANIYVDDELGVPIRVEGYDWPKSPNDEPRLLEEYTYTRLKLNVGLTDDDFRPELLSATSPPR